MHRLSRTLLLSGGLLAAGMPAVAQTAPTRTLTGTVSEKDGRGHLQALPGATVRTHGGAAAGTSSDSSGRYTLAVSDSAHCLIFSYTGYSPDTVVLQPGLTTVHATLHQPKGLGEVVVSHRRKTTEVSLLSTIKTERIGEGELMKAACCNLSESFETTPSVDVAFTDAISGYKQIELLGLASPYTLITRENIPDNRGLAAVTGLSFTPGTWIEGMQLSKGTGSVVNGYESVAGQINVELRKPAEEKEPRWLLNAYQNSQGRSEGNAVYRKVLNKRLSTNLMLQGRSQWARIDGNGDGFLDQPVDQQAVVLNRWLYQDPKGLELQAGVKATYTDQTGGQSDYRRGGLQEAGHPWGYDQRIRRIEGWTKTGKVFRNKPGTSVGLQLAGVYHRQEAGYGQRRYEGTQRSLYANLIFQTLLGNTNHTFRAGLSTLADRYDERLDGQPFSRNEIVPGAFAEYSYNFLEKFSLVAGLRGDYHNGYGAFVTPRLHLRWAPYRQTAIRASFGRAQRTANLFAENMGYMASNRQFLIVGAQPGKAYGLDPEVAWTGGLSLTQKFKIGFRDGTLSADYHYTHFQDQVVADVEDPHLVRFYNLAGPSYARSLQVQLDYEVIHNLDLRLAWRRYDVQATYGGILKQRPLVAADRAFANVGYEARKGWKLDYTVQWIGPKRLPALHEHHGGAGTGSYSPAFVQMSAQVTKGWKASRYEVYLGGENLTNYMQHDPILGAAQPFVEGFDASMIWGPIMGRSIYTGVRVRL